MTDHLTAAWTVVASLTDSILVRTLALTAVIFLVLFGLALARAAARPMPPQSDAEADQQWDDYLACLGLTRDDVRAAYDNREK